MRIARRVSHPNVCRVYDVGEAEGRHFLSMEYVEGEDLASLLKRIGRLPQDKAIEVARGVCAGLAAAHEKGVLHRDLKPANVMLDRQGQVVITDFGLAALAGQVPRARRPQRHAELHGARAARGGEVSEKSDIYALGLVLYEIFTGRRAFESPTLAGKATRRDQHQAEQLVVGGARHRSRRRARDPLVPRARARAAPALGLRGGGRAAGRRPAGGGARGGVTPAPEIVAGAGATTGLRPRAALLRLAAVVVGLAAVLTLSIRSSGLDQIGVESPDVLAQKARDILARLGYPEAPYDSAFGFGQEEAAIRYFEEQEKPGSWQELLRGRPPLIYYWYRTSPQRLLVLDVKNELMTPGIVGIWSPPATLAGMVNVGLDARGQLNFLQVLPPEAADAPSQPPPPDWDALFVAAGFERSQFQEAEPRWTSLAASDARKAWTGTWPGTRLPLRIEAAAFQGKPVFFNLVSPWTPPYRTHADRRTSGEKAAAVAVIALSLLVVAAAILLARRNYLSGRGDRRGAVRLAVAVFCLQMTLWLGRAHHFPSIGEFAVFVAAIAYSLFASAIVWLLYLSLEPYVRRHWPQTLISWSRLLSGRLRDPLVGRDLLSGVLLGLVWSLLLEGSWSRFGTRAPRRSSARPSTCWGDGGSRASGWGCSWTPSARRSCSSSCCSCCVCCCGGPGWR